MTSYETFRMALSRVGRFRADQSGTVTVEFVIVIPLLFWCFLATYTFFDAYRTDGVNVKASYTIGDQVSREGNVLVPAYIDGLGELLQMLVQSETGARLRVTAFQYTAADDSYRVIWSDAVGEPARLAGAAIDDIKSRLPEMGENEVHILTETWLDYKPADMVGMGDFTFYEPIVTRSRVGRICWKADPMAPDSTALC
jgi:hypothetical protein